jgi:hypothetical protein
VQVVVVPAQGQVRQKTLWLELLIPAVVAVVDAKHQ